MKKLLEFINGLSKVERAHFAMACNTTEGYLRKACSVGQQLGSDLCILIDRESHGAVMCEDLRPDVDWAYLRDGRERPGQVALNSDAMAETFAEPLETG